YREKIEGLGIPFRPVRPNLAELEKNPELVRGIMDLRRGTARVVREVVMPALPGAYEDTLAAAEGADLLVSHPLTFATRTVAEKKGLPWAASRLALWAFFSASDPPLLPPAQWLAKLRFLGPALHRPLFGLARW